MVWLTYRLAATFAFGLPLVLIVWSYIKKETSIIRLLSIYWKTSSLMAISILLLTNNQSIGYLTSFATPLLIVLSIWFWVDLNEEIDEMPPFRPLALTVRVWRWSLSFLGVVYTSISFISLSCFKYSDSQNCINWVEGPQSLNQVAKVIIKFLFGGNWSDPISGFIGYVALIIYIIGLIQLLIIRLPKQGRIAGGF